jgi:O-antigen/teichoic acid export membrane protein
MIGVKQSLHRIGLRAEDRPIWHRFRRNLSISLLGSGASLAIKLGQAALLTGFLMVADYGRILIILNLFAFLESFIGLRVSDAMFRFFPQFKEQQEAHALQGLLLLCLGISLVSGLLISGGMLALSPWLSTYVYRNPALAPLLNIYAFTVVISTFREVYEPILRIHDRYTSIVVPQVLGNLATVAVLCAYLIKGDGYNLNVIVAAFTIGVFVQTVPSLVLALRLVMPLLSSVQAKAAARALARYRPELTKCLLHSNLSGYLKFAVSPGDLFLLGLFSSPAQVALYGLARQLTAPLSLLQTNIQTAVTPEIASLAAGRKVKRLKFLLSRYMVSALVLGGVLVVVTLLLGRFFILRLSRPEYTAALPVFYLFLMVAWLMLVFLVFRPLALSLDLLNRHNLAQMLSSVIVVFLILFGWLNALTMAYVQLAGASILRILCNIPVWMRLHALIETEAQKDDP